jgi:hypothetical protein
MRKIGGTALAAKRILCSLLFATLPRGSVLADEPISKNVKVTPHLPARAADRSEQDEAGQAARSTAVRIRIADIYQTDV